VVILISKDTQGILSLIARYKRPLLYIIVGGINTGVDFVAFQLLYFFTPLAGAVCQGISYTLGVTCSFILNRKLTFRDHVQAAITRQAGKFLLVNLASLLVSVAGMHLLIQAGMSAPVAKIAITGVTAVMNYFGYKWFVFGIRGGKMR